MLGQLNPIMLMTFLYKLGIDTVNTYMEHPEILKFMKSEQKFDVCIIEIFNADALLVNISSRLQNRFAAIIYFTGNC
jgi:hypothetical protein